MGRPPTQMLEAGLVKVRVDDPVRGDAKPLVGGLVEIEIAQHAQRILGATEDAMREQRSELLQGT
jgi:hypothetical protein